MSKTIGLLGSGSQADEIESYLDSEVSIAFRAVSQKYLDQEKRHHIININSMEATYVGTPVLAAVGAPKLRKDIVEQWKGSQYFSLVASNACVSKGISLGKGSIVAPNVTVTTNVKIGDHTLINIGSTISHDCTIGDYVTISPGVNVAGRVELADGVFVGIGATISSNVKIAAGCVVGAGAVVIESVTTENSVIVGVPGKIIKINKEWLREI